MSGPRRPGSGLHTDLYLRTGSSGRGRTRRGAGRAASPRTSTTPAPGPGLACLEDHRARGPQGLWADAPPRDARPYLLLPVQ